MKRKILLILIVIVSLFVSCSATPVVLSPEHTYFSLDDGGQIIATNSDEFHFTGIVYGEFVIKEGNIVYGKGEKDPFCKIKISGDKLILYHYYSSNVMVNSRTYQIK